MRTTLGPRGMDKLCVELGVRALPPFRTSRPPPRLSTHRTKPLAPPAPTTNAHFPNPPRIHDGNKTTISNDGAKILQLLDIVHPAAKTLVDIARAQDMEIGDGTTTVTLLAAELLRLAKPFVEDGVHPQVIIRAYRKAGALAAARLKEISVGVAEGDKAARRSLLEKCASTALNSKLIAQYQGFFSPMIVDAIESLDGGLDVSMIGVKKVAGGSVTESFLVKGVSFKRTFSYAGFEQQPKVFVKPRILSLNVELELKSERENAEIRIEDPKMYQAMVNAEWDIIYEKLKLCVDTGANIVLSRLPIGDLATQYFADRGVFCAGRVHKDDLERCARATGARVQSTVYGLTPEVLGGCENFEERAVGAERYNIFTGCPGATTATFVLRGGAEQFIDESERSIHDSIMIVKNCLKGMRVVAGGGATELEISRCVKDAARGIAGKEGLVMLAYAKALELIPRQLADNAGFDATDILNRLRQKHADPHKGKWWGVDMEAEGICDTYESAVWEPVSSKVNSFSSAMEAACMVLSVDETVRNPSSQQPEGGGGGRGGRPGGGMAGGKKMSQALGGGGMQSLFKGKGVRMSEFARVWTHRSQTVVFISPPSLFSPLSFLPCLCSCDTHLLSFLSLSPFSPLLLLLQCKARVANNHWD